jgi:amidase
MEWRMLDVSNASLSELQAAMAEGLTTSVELTEAYLARIASHDKRLNSVRETNPGALSIAASSDARKRRKRGPLEGLPILLKDNIATDDKQCTTAGSLALEGAKAKRDATVTKLLREAGAVILGKANLTEWANILAVGMPSGYSSLGGQVRNAYVPAVDAKGVPIVQPGGSSAGSAVSVAAGFAAASIGTETSGSLLSPANQNGLVTVKPTVGLISRAGIIPISSSQDTAGPMTRTVLDSALILNVLAQHDKLDDATRKLRRPDDFTDGLDRDALRGARIGVPSDPTDPGNDVYYGPLSAAGKAVMEQAIAALLDLGATVVRASMPTEGWLPGPGTELAVLNRNPESPTVNSVARVPIVFLYELKRDLGLYLTHWAKGTKIRCIEDIVAFNAEHADRALRFGQDLFLAAAATKGDLSEPEYRAARKNDLLSAKKHGLDAYISRHKLDAVLFPGNAGAGIAAKAGYPSVQVPAGYISGAAGQETPDYPLGATFTGKAWSEHTLLRFAYAFEQATLARRMPPDLG